MAKSFNSIKAGWKNPNKDVGKKKSFKDIKSADYDFGTDESRINSFLKSAKDYFDNVESDTSAVNFNNATEKYSSNQNKMQTLGDEARTIRAYYNANKSKIDEATYNNMMEYLDAFDKGSSNVLDYYRKKADSYSKFETEAEYNDAVKVSELYNLPSTEIEKQMGFSRETYESDLAPLKEEYDKLNKDIQFYGKGDKSRFASAKDYNDAKIRRDELKKQITNLQGKDGIAYTTSSGQNITWSSLYDKAKAEEDFNVLYGELSANEDWGEASQYKTTIKGDTWSQAFDTDWEYEAGNKTTGHGAANSGRSAVDERGFADVTTDKEKEIFNYLYHTKGKESAMEWLESRADIYEKRREEIAIENAVKFAEEVPVLSDAVAVFSSALVSPMEYLANVVTGDIGKTTQTAAVSSAIKGTRMEQIDWEVGDWDAFDFLYGTGTSMAESALATAVYGKFGGVALGLSAAASSTNDALERGMSKGQAFTSGLVSGIFEGIFESWSIGAFSDLTKHLKRTDFRNLAKYIGKNMWNNAKEETLTEIANIAYDTLFNGDFSQYETTIRQYMASGMSESDAKKQVAIELGGQIAEAGGSGALMGFGFGVGGGVGAVNNTIQSGKEIKSAGQTRNVVDLGKSLGEGTESYQLANKITDKSSAYAIGKLYGIEADDIANANKGDMIKAFVEKGFNSTEASVLVNKILEKGSESVSNIRGMVSPAQVYKDVLNNPNSTVSQREEAYRGILQGVAENRLQKAWSKAVKNNAKSTKEEVSADAQGKETTQAENPVESKFESNAEGKDFNVANDKVIASKKLVSSEKDNMKFEVTYEDGATEEVDANDINFGNDGEALVYSAVMDMNIPVGIAETLIGGYKGNDVNSAAVYVNGVREAFTFGKYNQEADLNNGEYASQLTEEQRSNAFKLGGIYANEEAIAKEKAIKGETKPTDTKKQEGKVHFEGDKLSLKSVQDVSLESLGVLSKALGKDIHIFESYVDKNGKRVYKDANGNIKPAPNGFYDQKDGSIWIDLNAGNRGQGTIMYTVAHELTHFIKQWSPTKFKALADFLVAEYGKQGVSVADLVREQQAKAKKNGRNISYDVAFEEMVADSMETMLTDGKVIRKLAQKDKGLFDKIKSWIDNLLRRLNKEYKNYSPETREGQLIYEAKEIFAEVQKLFADALVDASDNFAIRGTDVGFIQKNMITGTGKLSGIMDSTRTEKEPMPKMVMDMSSGNGGKLFTDLATNYLIKGIGNGGAVNGYTVAQIREAIMKANGYNTKEIRNVQAFMKSMSDFMDEAGVKYRFIGLKDVENAKLHYSYNADGSIKSVVLSAMVKNGDYPVNFDFSSICKKRVAMSKLINKLCDMGAMDKGTVNLSPKNIFEINKALKDEGFETACLGCFVESKRYNIQEWANSFIKKWNEAVLKVNPSATYFGFTDGKTNFDNLTSNQVFAIDKAAQTFLNKTGQERRDKAKAVYNEKAKKGEALLEKLPKTAIAKIKKSQTLDDSMKDYFLSTDPKAFTLADVELLVDNEILAGKSISNKQKITKMVESGEQFQHLLRPSDLLTERGITQLEQLPNFHGILYGHYGSGTPKLVQGFTPYNSEIALLSEKKGDKTLAEYLYSIAGVRMQSFSDFQIQNVFDYLQMIADLSARKLPAHAYTKEISFAKLLGMTGIKTNLSVMFDIDTSVDDAHAGLTKYNPSIHQGEYAKIVLEDEQGKWVYNIGDYATQKAYEDYEKMMGNEPTKRFLQSIGFADAVKLQTTEGYTKNCGIIGVGYSDAHILAMLDDSRIRYVIPYHSSSLPHEIKVATNIEKGTDYTSTQNTMKIVRIIDKNGKVVDWSIKEAFKRLNNGKAVIEELNKHIKEDGWVVETKKAQNGHGTFDLYGDLSNTSDPRMTADNFMSWCAKNGSLPLFYQFANHNNYYKMLYDFNVYDNVTEEYAPQGAVTNTYPTGANVGADVVSGEFDDAFFKETVEHYMQVQNDFNARLDGTIDELADKIVNNTMPDADFGILNSSRDEAYMDAVNKGDMETAQRLVEEAAKEAGYTIKAYHGTKADFTKFSKEKFGSNFGNWSLFGAGFYFALTEERARYWGDFSNENTDVKVMPVYLRTTNMISADEPFMNDKAVDIVKKVAPSFDSEDIAWTLDRLSRFVDFLTHHGYTSNSVQELFVSMGYDGVDYSNLSAGKYSQYVVFNPEQVKSADPVTYDDKGNVIPLSQRFNEANDDIRYSDRSDYKQQVDEVIKNTHDPNNHVYMGTTPIRLSQTLGLPRLPMLITSTHVYTMTVSKATALKDKRYNKKYHYHNLGKDIVKALPDALNNPVMIIKSNTDSNDARFVVVTDLVDKNKNPVIVALEPYGDGYYWNVNLEANVTVSGYGKDGFKSYLATARNEGRILYAYKKYSQLNKNIPGVYFSDNILSADYSNNLARFKEIVNKKFLDKHPIGKGWTVNQPGELYSLRDVNPIMPTSNKWQRTQTTAEVKAQFPDLWDVSADESEVRNPTQISGTVKSYRKVYEFLKKTGFNGTILDASSGLGYGTRAGIEEYGFNVEDIEPYPDASYSPKYTDYSTLDKKYDVIISNAVLNVLPQDQRDALVVKMGEMLNDGGRIFVNVRGDDVKNASSKVAINEDLMEYYISKSGSYQKGFTKAELVAYLEDALGEGYTVMPTSFFGKTSAVVTKKESNILYSGRDDSSVSTRTLLANALEGAAQNDIEKNKLAQYKEKIALIEAEQNKLHELREKLFTKGIKGDERREIQDEATRTANRINTYDRQLFNLESTTALKNVLNREKELARKRQKQRDAENLKAYKEKRDAEVDYLVKKNKKAIESRHKTVLKHKISDVLFKLDRLLNRGNKKRNIKQGLHQTVNSAINLGRMLFNSNIENEDIIRFGISALTEKEKVFVAQYQKLLAKKDAFYKELDELQGKNMEGADFDRHDYVMLELDKINEQMRSLDKKLADVFERERARLNETEVTELVEKLAHDYAMTKTSEDEYIKNSFDEYKYNRLLTLAKALKGTTVKDMSKAQLQETYDAFKMIEHAVKTANDLFFEGQKADLMEYVENVQSEVKDVADEKKDRNAFVDKTLGELNKFTWENLRPVDAFARLGSKTFEKLFWNAIEGFSKAGRMVAEAGDFIEAVRKKYGYSKWDLEVAPKTFITTDGKEFKPSLADMMSIYAYSFREQAMPHMTEGGFTYDTGRTYKDKTNDDGKGKKGQTKVHKMSDPYILSEADINNIVSTLSDEQRAYVKECLPYFQVLATEGNKVSMVLHGIEIFKDKAYFPLKSSYDYLSSTAEVLNNAPTMASLQNIGMTKETTPGANNPIVLRGFDDVLSSHIEDMASYCSLALPITNLRKVFDNIGKTDADKPTSTKALISSRFGAEAKEYFEQWIIDLNGGIKGKGASGLFDKLFSRAKGVSVAANMSVIVQQYFAITRAMEIIDPKYFSPTNKEVSAKDMKEYEELCKYSGIAIIKEIGGYDVGAKGRVRDYINDRQAYKDLKYIRKKTDDVLMWGASAMDKLGWTTIWKAVKKEVAANGGYTVGSEEFLNACAKRFEEVVTKTQVYDSVASRSGYMRSQNVAVKYATSFMSEPTVMVGRTFVRAIELVRAIERKDKSAIKQAGSMFVRTALTISVSQVLGKLAQSLIYASRDDDEDEAFLEKWLSAFVENLHYDLKYLGLNNLPFVRDIISVIDGFSTDRPDMTLIGDVVNAIRKGATDGCTFDEATNLVGAIGNVFGIPVKNIVREFKSIGNFVDDVFVDDIAPTNLSGAIAEGFSGEDYSKGEKLFSVYESGDAQRVKDTVADWVKEKADSGKTEKEAKQSVKSSITSKYRDEYKKAYKNKDAEEMNRIRKFLYATGLWNSLTELDSLLAKWRTED